LPGNQRTPITVLRIGVCAMDTDRLMPIGNKILPFGKVVPGFS
jgi:hypothetical protein